MSMPHPVRISVYVISDKKNTADISKGIFRLTKSDPEVRFEEILVRQHCSKLFDFLFISEPPSFKSSWGHCRRGQQQHRRRLRKSSPAKTSLLREHPLRLGSLHHQQQQIQAHLPLHEKHHVSIFNGFF